MNNGYPPYGDPAGWGAQSQPNVPAQGGMNGQPGAQPPYGQQPYGQQPYVQQQEIPQGYAQQTWQPQVHQPQTYQQQAWQPYQQTPQQAWQPTAQQPAAQPPVYAQGQTQSQYPQYNQQGQPVYPQQGFSGYVSQPGRTRKKSELPLDVIIKTVIFGVLPVLFVLGLLMLLSRGSNVLMLIFLGSAVAGIIGMWLTDVISPNLRLTMSMVYGALCVVALVSALNSPVADKTNPVGQAAQSNQQSQQTGTGGESQYVQPVQQVTETPTATPDPSVTDGAAMEVLTSFMYMWHTNNDEEMVKLTAPSWRATVDKPKEALFQICLNRTPQRDYQIKMSGTDNDTTRTATVKVTIDRHDKRNMDLYSFKIIMLKEDGNWYVDPRSLKSHDKETPTLSPLNLTPTQPPLTTAHPNLVLYYNKDGEGTKYHLDSNCSEVGSKYRPMTASFYYSQLDEEPYCNLEFCNVCEAPLHQ